MSEDRKSRVVLMPIYKSYADPLVLHFINYLSDLELGFTFGNHEDSPKIGFVDRLLKRIGTFLMRRFPSNHAVAEKGEGKLHAGDIDAINYVNQSLLDEVVQSNVITTLFQNDQRIRSGKFNLPLYAETSIKMLLKTQQKMSRLKYSIKIVPVCINYERIFEASYLANEMISGVFQEVTMVELTQSIFGMRKGKLGKAFVKYGEPIDLVKYLEKHQSTRPHSVSLQLTRELYHIQQKEQPITMNSLVVSALMYYPKNEITIGAVKKSSKAIYDLAQEKEIKIYVSAEPQNFEINQAVLNLGFEVKGDPLNKKTGDASIVSLQERDTMLKRLSLGYYVNHLVVCFSNESILSHAYSLAVMQTGAEEVDEHHLIKNFKIISKIFNNEFLQ